MQLASALLCSALLCSALLCSEERNLVSHRGQALFSKIILATAPLKFAIGQSLPVDYNQNQSSAYYSFLNISSIFMKEAEHRMMRLRNWDGRIVPPSHVRPSGSGDVIFNQANCRIPYCFHRAVSRRPIPAPASAGLPPSFPQRQRPQPRFKSSDGKFAAVESPQIIALFAGYFLSISLRIRSHASGGPGDGRIDYFASTS